MAGCRRIGRIKVCDSVKPGEDIGRELGNVISNTPIPPGPGGVGPIWGGGACGSGVTSKIVPDKWGNNLAHADFKPACVKHDRCYDQRLGKKKCDGEFRKDLYKQCEKGFPGVTAPWLVQCNAVVESYYQAVRAAALGYPGASTAPLITWSYAGKINGKHCVQINEPSDPHTWGDNYLCTEKNLGIRWSFAGQISGMRCTQIHETSDPHTWGDNYLCVPTTSELHFAWSSAGAIAGQNCIKINEPADPHTWDDNFLCFTLE